jgi:anti-sigma factor RsiW
LAHCDDIAPLLGALHDGELSGPEADRVTQHLDGCETCKETLLDYLLLGHHLRTATAMTSLDGFTETVMRGIAGARRPFRGRLLNRLEDLRERWVAAVSLAGATVALATLALVLAEPHTWDRISARFHGAPATSESAQNSSTGTFASSFPAARPAQSNNDTNSEAFISRLEAKPPSVALWSEPDTKTTVIWLGDDASGND